jgi:hypothetical protein
MAGSGLNIDVSVSSRSRPICVDTASVVSAKASSTPARYPCSSTASEMRTFSISSPLASPSTSADAVAVKVGSSRSLFCQRAASSQSTAMTTRIRPLRTPACAQMRAAERQRAFERPLR